MDKYEVIVGNIGRVYSGNNLKEALQTYRAYREQSESGVGRAGGESVTLMDDGDPWYEHFGTVDS